MRARAIFVATGIFRPADSGRTEYVLALRSRVFVLPDRGRPARLMAESAALQSRSWPMSGSRGRAPGEEYERVGRPRSGKTKNSSKERYAARVVPERN